MDWIKVKPKHVLYEHISLTDKEFRAWITSMCITAEMEKMPRSENLKKHIHPKTLKNLNKSLMSTGTSVEEVSRKVLTDVRRYNDAKEYERLKKKRQRDTEKEKLRLELDNVPGDNTVDVPSDVPSDVPRLIREEKRRGDKKGHNINKSVCVIEKEIRTHTPKLINGKELDQIQVLIDKGVDLTKETEIINYLANEKARIDRQDNPAWTRKVRDDLSQDNYDCIAVFDYVKKKLLEDPFYNKIAVLQN